MSVATNDVADAANVAGPQSDVSVNCTVSSPSISQSLATGTSIVFAAVSLVPQFTIPETSV